MKKTTEHIYGFATTGEGFLPLFFALNPKTALLSCMLLAACSGTVTAQDTETDLGGRISVSLFQGLEIPILSRSNVFLDSKARGLPSYSGGGMLNVRLAPPFRIGVGLAHATLSGITEYKNFFPLDPDEPQGQLGLFEVTARHNSSVFLIPVNIQIYQVFGRMPLSFSLGMVKTIRYKITGGQTFVPDYDPPRVNSVHIDDLRNVISAYHFSFGMAAGYRISERTALLLEPSCRLNGRADGAFSLRLHLEYSLLR